MANSDFLFDELPVQFAPQSISQSGLGAVWTQHKAQLIAKYIFLFTMITRHGAYIDGFAGPKNDKLTDSWAAELVVNMEPRRLREVFLCDLDPIKVRKLEEMVGAQTDVNKRKYRIYSGDFNERIRDILSSGLIKEKTATFCLIDQFTLECHWETLRQIATHKPVGARKIEVFYFLGTGWLHRALTGHKRNITRPDLWWGGDGWKSYITESGQHFAIRMAERFRNELGYTYVKSYPIYQKDKGEGRIMFHMIHGSDHPEAHKLMARAHKAVTKVPPLKSS